MLKKPFKKILLLLVFSALSFLSTTCGLEEAYYLPQVPEVNIETPFNTSATINLPGINLTEFYYAQNYKIFYKIYISDSQTSLNNTSVYSEISLNLVSDYNYILPNTDPTNASMGIAAGTLFDSRNYYELFYVNNNKVENIDNLLTTSGGNVSIIFPTATGDYPTLSVNNGSEYRLLRSDVFFTSNTNLDDKRYFRNSSDINVSGYADLVPRTDLSLPQTAFVSMYIVAFGTHPTNFTNIYSKPTHICVFKVTDK